MYLIIRGLAFIIDYNIIILIYGTIDNLCPLPLTELMNAVLFLVIFCGYFMLFEKGVGGSSLGKKFTKLEVAKDDGSDLTRQDTLNRSLVLGILTLIGWGNLAELLPYLPIPNILTLILATTQIILITCNIWLCRQPFGYVMLQDKLTGTRVARQPDPLMGLIEQPSRSSRMSQILGAFILVSGLGYAVVVLMAMNLPASGVTHGKDSLHSSIRDAFYQQHGIRVRPQVTQLRSFGASWSNPDSNREIGWNVDVRVPYANWNGDQTEGYWERNENSSDPYEFPSETLLNVDLWIPYVQWNERQADDYWETALRQIAIEPGYFTSGGITLRTGVEWYSVSESRGLNLP